MLASAAGAQGMIAGQARDLEITGRPSAEEVRRLHELKTGRMILAPVMGAAAIVEASGAELELWSFFGAKLGFAFQLADDLLDAEQDRGHARSWISLSGIEETKALLAQVSGEALQALDRLGRPLDALKRIVFENQERRT
jgi:geranylgeranyl pyrophosphate synthase